MLSEAGVQQVFLACGSTDLRKSIDGLAAIVTYTFKLDPFSPCLFVFCNRRQDKLKILHWDHNGFWLYYRRLERGRFQWPQEPREKPMAVSKQQLQWLLSGLALEQKRAHPAVAAQAAV